VQLHIIGNKIAIRMSMRKTILREIEKKRENRNARNRRGRVKIGMHETERENAVITKSR
jgi:hypothetical protein